MAYRPLISVCIPVYNTELYLDEAIKGVLSQTYDNFELIICDNCSTDSSPQIAQHFAADPRVRFIPNQWNIGFAGNLQKTTSLAQGELLIVNCADDIMLPQALETYVQAIEQSSLDPGNLVLMADTYMIDADGQPLTILGKAPDRFEGQQRPLGKAPKGDPVLHYTGHKVLQAHLADLEFFGWLGSIMFSHSFRARTEGYQGGKWISPDQEFMYKVLALDPPVIYLQEPLFHYRVHESNQLGTERRQGIIKHSLDQYEYTFQYPNSFLAQFGVSQQQVQEVFIDRDCLRKVLRELAAGSWTLALRYLAFALATYPGVAIRNPKLYLGLAGLLTGPLGRPFASAGLALWNMYHRRIEANGHRRYE